MAAEVLEDLGFGDLGFYSLSVLYFTFAFSCFIATPIVNKCGERFSMTLGAFCYFTYVSSFVFASASIKYEEKQLAILGKGVIEAIILITAAFNGFGASILWVAQGRYLSCIANDSNKGTYNSIFFAFFMACLIVGVLFGAIVLDNTDAFTFYCAMSATCLASSMFFLLLPSVNSQENHTDSSKDIVKPQVIENEMK